MTSTEKTEKLTAAVDSTNAAAATAPITLAKPATTLPAPAAMEKLAPKAAKKSVVKKSVSVAKATAKSLIKPATKTPVKTAAKVTAKPAAKATTKAPVKPLTKPAAKTLAVPKTEKAVKLKKPKLVRDSFTIPKAEYTVLDDLKQRATKLARLVKKSELIRAGVKALAAMTDAAFLAALKAVPMIKTGRPSKAKPD